MPSMLERENLMTAAESRLQAALKLEDKLTESLEELLKNGGGEIAAADAVQMGILHALIAVALLLKANS